MNLAEILSRRLSLTITILTLMGMITAAVWAIESRYVSQEQLAVHTELEQERMKTLAAILSQEIADKVMDRINKRRI